MTFEEAKKILKKEMVISFHSTKPFVFKESGWIEHEKPSVLEAFRVLAKEGYYISISGHDYNMREKRLQKEYEKNTKAPGPGEEQPKEGNPALKEAAYQFNDALLDEQAKKIAELTKEKTNLEDQITILNACKEYNENFGRKQIKRLGKEISKLNSIIHDKNAVLADVAEELRLSKIREKNLTELCQKYVGENEKLKNELEEKNYLMDMLRCGSREYCEYGIAAEKMIQKMADIIVYERPVFSKDFEQYRRWANGYRFNPQLPELSEEEEKKLSPGKDIYPTEDNPEEVTMEEILEHVRKALEEGGTVSISYDKAEEGADQSATIVQHRKSIVDLFKEIKHLWQ